MKWDLEAIAAACGGTPTGSVDITGVSTDTRSIGEGDLYVALRGETFDGHDFADRAMEAGAAGVLVEHGRLAEGSPGVEVDDTLAALRALAVRRREELTAQVVALRDPGESFSRTRRLTYRGEYIIREETVERKGRDEWRALIGLGWAW